MTEAELLKVKGVGAKNVAEILRVNAEAPKMVIQGTTRQFTVPSTITVSETIKPGGIIQAPPGTDVPTAEMQIVNLTDYDDPESYPDKTLYVVALREIDVKYLKLYALRFCAERNIQDLNYGLALEGIVRTEKSRNPMYEAPAPEDSNTAQIRV